MLSEGRRDVSVAYLVGTPYGRKLPENFLAQRRIWNEIESQVFQSTYDARREAVKKLLIDDPKSGEHYASAAYARFNPVFGSLRAQLFEVLDDNNLETAPDIESGAQVFERLLRELAKAQFTSRVRPCYVFCEIRGMD